MQRGRARRQLWLTLEAAAAGIRKAATRRHVKWKSRIVAIVDGITTCIAANGALPLSVPMTEASPAEA